MSGRGFPINRPYRTLKAAAPAGNAAGHLHDDAVTSRARTIISEVAAYLQAAQEARDLDAELAVLLGGES